MANLLEKALRPDRWREPLDRLLPVMGWCFKVKVTWTRQSEASRFAAVADKPIPSVATREIFHQAQLEALLALSSSLAADYLEERGVARGAAGGGGLTAGLAGE